MEEKNFIELFKKELIDLNNNNKDIKEDFFTKKSLELIESGYVKESFKDAIIARENEYPTGLVLENINLAIPHTDTEHIKEPFVYINRLKNKIEFNQMGNEEDTVSVKDVWMLGIKDGAKQVDLLAFIMEIFSDPDFIKKYQAIDEAEELLELLESKIS